MPPERSGPIAGVVLAAGSSARMGTNKLLLKIGGESVLRRAARRALDAGLSPTLVVLGHEVDAVRAELAGLACRTVVNPEPARGKSSSVHVGLGAVPPEAIAAAVILADMPLVTEAMIAELGLRYRRGAAPLVVSEYGGVLAPPMLYDRSLFPELLEMGGDGCGKHVVTNHLGDAEVVRWPKAALADLDVPADYERIQAESRER